MYRLPNPMLSAFILCMFFSLAHADIESRSVEATATMSARPEEVLQAFLNGDDLTAWWKVSRSLVEQKVGGVWSVTWDDWGPEKTQHAWVGVVETLTPQKLIIGHLVMIEPATPLLGPMQLEVEVKSVAAGSTVTIYHRGYKYGEHWDPMYDAVVAGWQHVLGDMQVWFEEEY